MQLIDEVLPVKRIHPGLPMRAEVQVNPALFYSDHIPQLMSVPLGDGANLNIMSYNVYQAGLPCGYTLPLEYDHNARRDRIASGIKLCVDRNNVDVILLQEVDQEQRDKLAEKLGDGWFVSKLSVNGLVTCYRKYAFECNSFFSTKNTFNPNEITNTYDYLQILTLKRRENATSVQLVNIHGDFGVQKKDNVFRQLLTQDPSMNIHVVAGDINIPMAEMHGQVGVTGMVPPQFNFTNLEDQDNSTEENKGYEIPNCTDGGLYKTTEGAITKMRLWGLDIATGYVIDERVLNQDQPRVPNLKEQLVYRAEADQEDVKSGLLKKDIAILTGVSLGSAAVGAGIGAAIGTFAFPGVGTAAGALIGAMFGAGAGMLATGWQGIMRSQLVGGKKPMPERVGAGILATLGAAGIGALLGTFVFPGIGTLIGAAIGAGFGAVTSGIIGGVTHPRSQQPQKKPTFVAKVDEASPLLGSIGGVSSSVSNDQLHTPALDWSNNENQRGSLSGQHFFDKSVVKPSNQSSAAAAATSETQQPDL
jgi:hypothetical protein